MKDTKKINEEADGFKGRETKSKLMNFYCV